MTGGLQRRDARGGLGSYVKYFWHGSCYAIMKISYVKYLLAWFLMRMVLKKDFDNENQSQYPNDNENQSQEESENENHNQSQEESENENQYH